MPEVSVAVLDGLLVDDGADLEHRPDEQDAGDGDLKTPPVPRVSRPHVSRAVCRARCPFRVEAESVRDDISAGQQSGDEGPR
jgi:hypothetical protein